MNVISKIKKLIPQEALEDFSRLPSVGETAKKTHLQDIFDAIAWEDDSAVYGLRSIDPKYEVPKLGGKVKPSKIWKEDYPGQGSYESPTRFNAEGPSAIELDAVPIYSHQGKTSLDLADNYLGNKYLLRAEGTLPLQEWNSDYGEIILDNPRVIAGFEPVSDEEWRRVLSLSPMGAGAAAITAAMLGTPSESHAAMQNMTHEQVVEQNRRAIQDYNDRLKAQGFASEEAPLKEPLWSPLDLLTAPIGVAGAGGKALTMALDAPATFALDYGMEKFGDLTNYLDLVAQKTETERQALPMARLGR